GPRLARGPPRRPRTVTPPLEAVNNRRRKTRAAGWEEPCTWPDRYHLFRAPRRLDQVDRNCRVSHGCRSVGANRPPRLLSMRVITRHRPHPGPKDTSGDEASG